MSLSTSRQQFLAYESHNPEEIHYGKKGGIFISTCICVILVILALVFAAIIGIIVFYITYFKLSQKHEENFWDEKEMFAQPSQPSAELRLPPHVVPSFYRLKIRANLDNSSFNGEVYITISASKRVKEIILHSKDLSINSDAKLTEQIYEKVETLHLRAKREVTVDSNVTQSENNSAEVAKVEVTTQNIVSTNDTEANNITEITTESPVSIAGDNNTETTKSSIETFPVITEVSHSNVRNVKIDGIKQSSGDRLIVTLATALRTDVDYILQLSFKGNISNSLTGFYKSSYTSSNNEVKNLGVTQFEPTSARAAFPCFDEPAFKAKFEISIAHPQNLTVLSNMNVAMQENILDEPDWQWTHFERSVNMSTYLVAYTLSDFKSIETSYVSKNNVTKKIRIWTRPEYLSKAKYAATITPKLLSFYEEVFGLPYALDKLDLIAIPDFSSGAMENWGLITFRETTLLFDETEGVPRDKQNVAIDVAHELAHQWFGNLVTMRWWTDLWLNEGFATYIEYVGVDHIEPEWNMLESFSRDKMELLRTDALKNTSPVSRQVVDASEISQKFDEISYSKASNLIRMLNHTISKELLHKGLAIYLQDWKYRNAEENDLWAAMSKATQEVVQFKELSVVDFMNTWTRQPGYPVVNVKRDYMSGDVTFEQRLFTSGNEMHQAAADRLWHIPISYTNIEGVWSNQNTKPKLFLKDRSVVTHIDINNTQPLYVNVDAIGYYRVNYDQNNWELLSKALKSGQIKSPIAKAQLIDDAFNLAKTSLLNYSYALGLTSCVVKGEDSKIVWDLLLNNMGFLKYNLRATSSYMYFQDYMQTLLAEQLKRVNYGLDKPKDDNEAFLIENLVMWECFMEAPRCLRWARQQYDSWIAQPDLNNNTIPSYLRSLVYNIVIKHGGRQEFEMFWNLFHNTTDPNVKSLLITSLPSTREESLITWLLEKSLSEIPKQYAVAAWSVEPPLGTAVAQRFLARRFDEVHRKFTDMDSFMFPSIVANVFGFVSTDDELDKLKSFALEHKEKLQPMSQTIQKIMDTASMRIGWCRKHLPFIVNWFKDHSTGNSKSKTSSAPPVSLETNDLKNLTTNLTTSTPQVTSEVNNSTEKT